MISEKFGFNKFNYINRVYDANVDTTTSGEGRGLYQFSIANSDSANLPTNSWFFLITLSGTESGSDYASQLALGMTSGNIYYRRKGDGVWTEWLQIQYV